ncbi:MAG TPA: hypothetical protein VLB80_05230 [Candidatus Babeliales bacterium]|nr:hypothetical protein [Candidatus Babeliales bacterium]
MKKIKTEKILVILIFCSLHFSNLFSMDNNWKNFTTLIQKPKHTSQDLNKAKNIIADLCNPNNPDHKKNSRKILLQVHPDKNKGDFAEELTRYATNVINDDRPKQRQEMTETDYSISKLLSKITKTKNENTSYENFRPTWLHVKQCFDKCIKHDSQFFCFTKITNLIINKLLSKNPAHEEYVSIISQINNYNKFLDKQSLQDDVYLNSLDKAIEAECNDAKKMFNQYCHRND